MAGGHGGHGHPNLISKKIPENLRKGMELFQAKNNLPIHLKGGPVDRALFGITCALIFVGVGSIGKLTYDLAYGKK